MEADDFRDEDITSSVEKYEEMVKNRDWQFFDPEELENIIDFYISDDKLKKASSVVEFAQEQHPYSVTFIIKKSHIALLSGNYDEALELAERAEVLEPSNEEVQVLKCN